MIKNIKEDDVNWNKCRECLGSDKLDPLDCVDITCHFNSARLDTRKRKTETQTLINRIEDFMKE